MSTRKPTRPLTPKQQRFAEEYVVDCNATQAAIRAGYSAKTAEAAASRLLINVNVSEEIKKRLAAKAKRTNLDADWVLKRWEKIVERCMQHEPVLDSEGNETGEYRFDSRGANTALQNLAKHLGMLRDKLELTGKDGGAIEVSDISDEERIERLAKLAQVIKLRANNALPPE